MTFVARATWTMESLEAIRAHVGRRTTVGLSDHWVRQFLATDARLAVAIHAASESLPKLDPKLLRLF